MEDIPDWLGHRNGFNGVIHPVVPIIPNNGLCQYRVALRALLSTKKSAEL
jgi:hypothetical protein